MECVFDVNRVCLQVCYQSQCCQLLIEEVTAESHRAWTVSKANSART